MDVYNADVSGPVINHTHTLMYVMSHNCCLLDFCTHPAHTIHMLLKRDHGHEEDMSSCGRAVENKEIKTETKRGRQRKSATNYVLINHIPMLKTDLCAIQG